VVVVLVVNFGTVLVLVGGRVLDFLVEEVVVVVVVDFGTVLDLVGGRVFDF